MTRAKRVSRRAPASGHVAAQPGQEGSGPTERATIYAVAGEAGVSITTVSRVLNGNGPVAPSTRSRILRAIRDLEYEPSWLGRALAGQRQTAVGIVFPDLSGPYHTGVIAGLESWATAADLALFILGLHGRDRTGDLVAGFAQHVSGLVLTASTVPDPEAVRLKAQGIRVVLLGRSPVEAIPAVRAQNRPQAKELTEHLLQVHGLRRLRFLGDPRVSPDVTERWEGFVDAHKALGVRARRSPTHSALTQAAGYQAALELLRALSAPDGIVCANDEIALGVYAACAELGISIPGDVAVTGWDDIAQANWVSPGLTTVHQPLERLGVSAGETLSRLLHDDPVEPGTTWLESTLVWRPSCGCPPAPSHGLARPPSMGAALPLEAASGGSIHRAGPESRSKTSQKEGRPS